MENKRISVYGIIIAGYTAISLLGGSFSFGMIQIRIAELLLVLCLYDKRFIVPVTLGCFVTNMIGVMSGMNPLIIDLVIGTLATFLSGIFVYLFRNIRFHSLPLLSLIMPVIINAVMIAWELYLYFNIDFLLLALYVGAGELISVFVLGLLLYKPIGKTISKYVE